MKHKFLKNKNIILLGVLYSLIIFIFTSILYNSIPMPTILNDEFGYWSTGAFLNNEDWTGLTAYCQYYSYGYGIFLAILIAAFKTPLMIYRSALFLNSIMLVISMILGYKILNELKINLSKNMLMCISFVSILFSSYIFNSQIAWAECLLLFLYVLLTYLIVLIDKQVTFTRIILICIVTMYLYIVHQRSLGVLCTVLFIVILMTILKKMRFTYLITFLACLLLCFIAHSLIKEYFQNNLWISTDELIKNGNDYSGQVSKLSTLFSFTGIIYFVLGILGRISYLGISTLGLFYYGFYKIVVDSLFNGLSIFNGKHKNNEKFSIISIFLLLSFLSTVFIAIVFILIPGRIDNLIYGRYFEWIIYPILLISLGKIIENKNKFRLIFIFILVIFSTSIITYSVLVKLDLNSFVGSCSIGLISYYWYNRNYVFIIIACLITSIISYYIFVLIQSKKIFFKYLGLVFILLYWCIIGYNAIDIEFSVNVDRKEAVMNITESINKNELENKNIKYLNEDIFDTLTLVSNIQFLNPQRKIEVIEKNDLNNGLEDVILLVSSDSENIDILNSRYMMIYQDTEIVAFTN